MDSVAALVLGPTRPVEYLLVNGALVVEGGEPRTADLGEVARESLTASHEISRSWKGTS